MMDYYGNLNGWDNMHSMMNWTGSGFGWSFMMIFFWILIIGALFVFIKWINDQNKRNYALEKGKTAINVLEERYAKGEIDREEFLKVKKDLNGA